MVDLENSGPLQPQQKKVDPLPNQGGNSLFQASFRSSKHATEPRYRAGGFHPPGSTNSLGQGGRGSVSLLEKEAVLTRKLHQPLRVWRSTNNAEKETG